MISHVTLCDGADRHECERCARFAERPENAPAAAACAVRRRPMMGPRGCMDWRPVAAPPSQEAPIEVST